MLPYREPGDLGFEPTDVRIRTRTGHVHSAVLRREGEVRGGAALLYCTGNYVSPGRFKVVEAPLSCQVCLRLDTRRAEDGIDP